METFKLDSKFKPAQQERNCANCAFAVPERMPQQIQTSLVCHAGPAQVVIVPTASGFQAMTMFPPMQPEQFCFLHRYAQEFAVESLNKISLCGKTDICGNTCISPSGHDGPHHDGDRVIWRECPSSLNGKFCELHAGHYGLHKALKGDVCW